MRCLGARINERCGGLTIQSVPTVPFAGPLSNKAAWYALNWFSKPLHGHGSDRR